ncbi:MAG: FadR family transcriptional regulator [Clostridiales bacterium]|nr:FadR family transcriptional regulator [Clostridiales bacterium]
MIAHSSVTDQVVQYFKENISTGKWRVGEKIPSENQLTEILGVSRASVRSAIRELAGIGVLESQHGKGTFLVDDQVDETAVNERKITTQDCRDTQKVLEFRCIVEPAACFLATKYATDELIEGLQKCLDRMTVNKKTKEIFTDEDAHFHQMICKASQNSLLEKSMAKVFEEARKDHGRTYELFGYNDGIYYHRMILQAMRSGDADRAREIMYDHLRMGYDKMRSEAGPAEPEEDV